MSTLKSVLRFLLLSPVFAFLIVFDIVKIPVLGFLIFPIFALLDIAEQLRGERSNFLEIAKEFTFMGCLTCRLIWNGRI